MPIKILYSVYQERPFLSFDDNTEPSTGDYGVSEQQGYYWFNGKEWIDISTGKPYKNFQDYLNQAELC